MIRESSPDRKTSVLYDVYGLGNALVDFLVFIDDDFLAKHNISKGTMTLVDQPAHETFLVSQEHEVISCSGGSAANTIVGLAALGARTCYNGKVGDDDLGRFYGNDLAKLGIDFISRPSSRKTGSCVSLITKDAERSMLTFLGASSLLEEADLDEEKLCASRYIYLEGYLWDSESARKASARAMELAKREGVKIAFSYSDPLLVERFHSDFRYLTREFCDLVFCNHEEATRLTDLKDPLEAAQALARDVERVCVTMGGNGAVVSDRGHLKVTPPLAPEEVKDTTGAGDLYASGVLRGLTLGLDLVSSSLLGARVASAVVERVGARVEPGDLR